MLIYRVLNTNDSLYKEELWYLNNIFGHLPSRIHKEGLNSFNYEDNRHKRHFFVFSEDALKFLESKRNPNNYKIGEFYLNDDLAIKYSGFGTRYEEIESPSFEVALPFRVLLKDYFIPAAIDEIRNCEPYLSEENICDLKEENYYFKFSCLYPTGNIFDINDARIKTTYREFYSRYELEAWKEFLKVYKVFYDSERNFMYQTKRDSSITEEHLEERGRLLKKYKLI